jgi:hypothetical protein
MLFWLKVSNGYELPLAYIRSHLGSFEAVGIREKLQKFCWLKFCKPIKELIDQIFRFSTSFARCSVRLALERV